MFYKMYNPQGPRRSLTEQLAHLGVDANDIDTVAFRLLALCRVFILVPTLILAMHIGIIAVQSERSSPTLEDTSDQAPKSTALQAI
jgi:hypothetical protein